MHKFIIGTTLSDNKKIPRKIGKKTYYYKSDSKAYALEEVIFNRLLIDNKNKQCQVVVDYKDSIYIVFYNDESLTKNSIKFNKENIKTKDEIILSNIIKLKNTILLTLKENILYSNEKEYDLSNLKETPIESKTQKWKNFIVSQKQTFIYLFIIVTLVTVTFITYKKSLKYEEEMLLKKEEKYKNLKMEVLKLEKESKDSSQRFIELKKRKDVRNDKYFYQRFFKGDKGIPESVGEPK